MAVLEMEVEIKDPDVPVKDIKNVEGKIEFKHVTFKYPGAKTPVLNNISFTAEGGKTTAFIGSTGSGKSTLINLVPRFYEVTDGSIEIDGHDIRSYQIKDLHQKIGYVPQRGILFGGTIKENILFGQHEDEEDIMKDAAKIAQAEDFIIQYEDQYAYQIAQGGKNVSGGQRQRLSIARAIAKKPEIFIFDDSFSALDYQTDRKLRKQLDSVKATKLIVAQRINTIRNADQIIVLDQGEIVGVGVHQELLKTCQVYQEIASSQLSKEEL